MALLAGLVVALLVATPGPGRPTAAVAAVRPNVLVVVTDDQMDRPSTVTPEIMPNVYRDLVAKGTRFTNAFVTNSWCCPSRASILTGQYSHTNGVWTTGGQLSLPAWREHEGSTLATWLHDAGYRTGMVGKYLNDYGKTAEDTYVPPGWDDWHAVEHLVYSVNSGFYNYDLFENGQTVHYGSRAGDYSTRVLTRKARAFVKPRADGKPWFLYLAYTSPHGPIVVDPLDVDSLPTLDAFRGPNVCEPNLGDKPLFVQQQATCTAPTEALYDQKVRHQGQMLRSVDRGLGTIVADLRASGQLRNTLIVYMSDNGYMLSAHGLTGKEMPYEESIRVPIVVRWDALGDTPGKVSQAALNIDIAPTVVDAAGVSAHNPFDGRSLLPLLRRDTAGWRSDFLVEHRQQGLTDYPSFCAVRSGAWKYVQYATGERELYDLRADRWELVSRDGQPAYAAVEAGLRARLSELCVPPPPGWTPVWDVP